MESTADDDLAELGELTRQLRGQLMRHAMHGAWAAPGGSSPRVVRAPDETVDEAVDEETASTVDVLAEPMPSAIVEPMLDVPEASPAISLPLAAFDAPDAFDAFSAPAVLRKSLPQIRAELGDCTRCKLHTTRKTIVFGVGTSETPLMFVGEAPGEQEDRRGEPFVGPAGQLLDKMIEAMGWSRDTVYIANTTKCRPPGNRNPQPDELSSCMPFLHQQIAAIAPRIIVALGRPASNQLLGVDAPISTLRGKFHDYARASGASLKIMPTFHPAYLLRDPDKKRQAWADLKLVMAELARLGIAAPRPASP